ncbi:MAG: cbb3-type cytochrome c oxidase subunit I [Ginsengibacter sp.]
MMIKNYRVVFFIILTILCSPILAFAQADAPFQVPRDGGAGIGQILLMISLLASALAGAFYLVFKTSSLRKMVKNESIKNRKEDINEIISKFDIKEIESYLKINQMKKKDSKNNLNATLPALFLMMLASFFSSSAFAQTAKARGSLFTEGGVIITLILILTPILAGIILMIEKVGRMSRRFKMRRNQEEAERISNYLKSLPEDEVSEILQKRKEVLNFEISGGELSGNLPPVDNRGILKNVNEHANLRFIEEKRRAIDRPQVDPQLSKLIIWYLISATVWLIFGTTVGEYVGIKFVAPDADSISWLSFGRLRPVHTNSVFWGWSSLAMIGLGYYVIPRVGNNQIHNIKWGWITLWLINAAVLLGSIALMAGINNGGGEFREYIWPIQLLFAIGVVLTLANYLKTVAKRKTKEIYVSNWYIIAAVMFVIVITIVAYVPYWQNGLGETISQGYYMHQGVGMWFMMFVLGLVYYFLPQQLNKPIYSYSLGILAFWSQILFYTLIGSHHFVFSAIPWTLQTVAIVGSVGMVIPVIAGSTNFIMTFKGSWHKLSGSYTLPFMLIGTIFYFTGSLQGTAEAFRTTNLYWHFTDFTVAHSHLTMYGIIAFFLWGFIYAIVPRITRQEPPQVLVGIHFWLAFIGLLFYSVPLMIGGTMKGIMWMDAKPFIDSVSAMAPYWLWRAIGGTLMWASHLVFAYNMYKMIRPSHTININAEAVHLLHKDKDADLVDIR